MRLDNPKQHWKKGAKENIWTVYYGCRVISIEIGEIDHGAFFECSKSDIIFFDTSDGVKRIELHKGGNIKPNVMKEL
jgi:hypothetical protein